MRTDIALEHAKQKRRIVIDTKFTWVLIRGWHHDRVVRSGYLYQIYSYLRSQAGLGMPLADHAAGLLLHPAIGETVDETVVIQGHPIRSATLDLAGTAPEIRARLVQLIEDYPFL